MRTPQQISLRKSVQFFFEGLQGRLVYVREPKQICVVIGKPILDDKVTPANLEDANLDKRWTCKICNLIFRNRKALFEETKHHTTLSFVSTPEQKIRLLKAVGKQGDLFEACFNVSKREKPGMMGKLQKNNGMRSPSTISSGPGSVRTQHKIL